MHVTAWFGKCVMPKSGINALALQQNQGNKDLSLVPAKRICTGPMNGNDACPCCWHSKSVSLQSLSGPLPVPDANGLAMRNLDTFHAPYNLWTGGVPSFIQSLLLGLKTFALILFAAVPYFQPWSRAPIPPESVMGVWGNNPWSVSMHACMVHARMWQSDISCMYLMW